MCFRVSEYEYVSSKVSEPSISCTKEKRKHCLPVTIRDKKATHESQIAVWGTRPLRQNHYQPKETVIKRHKTCMKNKYENLCEGIKTEENRTLLNRIYTQLYIIEGKSEWVNEEHEVFQMEKTQRRNGQYTPINCLDIFKRVTNSKDLKNKGAQVSDLKSVLTKGIAGIGKTVSVQKFILDWAEGNTNLNVNFMFLLPFRELNLIKDDQYSLHGLLCDFHPELKDLDPKIFNKHKSLFIFDGLDESRIPLDFLHCEKVSDITRTTSLGVLMTNLIKGELLPSARFWITCRPAAANQIPPKHIDRVTEIQGFNDPQKEEYFRKRISDQDKAQKIISHIKTARSLHIMCHIPVFCWITATVLQRIINQHHTEIPKTLTEMYCYFLITQTNMKNKKYEEKDERDPEKLLESNRNMLLKLAELAFKQLMTGNVMFYEEDLRNSGIDVTEASVYSGIFTEIFKEESVLYQRKVYCFVHLSFQEFLAAVYVLHCYGNNEMKELWYFKREWASDYVPLDDVLIEVVYRSLKSTNGHLDLFLRFLLGMSLESNQRLLQGLLTQTHTHSEKTTKYIKSLIKGEKFLSTERSINLFLCLTEMKDQSISKEILEFLKSDKTSGVKLSNGQCSALAYMLLTSEEVQDELDLTKCSTSEEGYRILIPAVTACRRAVLAVCKLGSNSCRNLGSVLQSVNSSLKELDLSNNDLQDSGVELLSTAVKSSHCILETLRLSGCMVTEVGCSSLASALKSNPSHLRELDLTYNHPGESGCAWLPLNNVAMLCPLMCLCVCLCVCADAYKLTLDPNTAHPRIYLSQGNTKVESVRGNQPYTDHPDRFDCWKQVLSVESLTGRCFWEAEFKGELGIVVAVSYKGIKRKGRSEDIQFGFNNQSWSLQCLIKSYIVYHNRKRMCEFPHPQNSNRVGVYLDCSEGTLSFYSIAPFTHTLTHIHTFKTTFTEPLYAGIGVEYGRSVCEVL
uniref:B30.2/SPRY domain-containing protein n=1 Tax=Astyanax mexicanus TaxID=7994 RepID=A0A8B9H1H2_ASTMX